MVIALIRHLVEKLVDNPQAISITETFKDTVSVIELRVASEDLGKVIGKEGRTARSLRTLVGAMSKLQKIQINLEIIE
jgi:hypothetical protein